MATPLSPPRPPAHQQDGAVCVGSWTPSHEARLVYVQGRLREAQKRWSEDQDAWIDEKWKHETLTSPVRVLRGGQVHSLEDLKRKCLKAEKKLLQGGEGGGGRGRKGSLAALWKKRSAAGGGGAKRATTTATTMTEAGAEVVQKIGDKDGEGTDDDDDGEEEEQANGEPSRRRLSTLLRRTISLSPNPAKSTENSGGGRRYTYDLGTSGPDGEAGKEKGMGRLKRWGSGR
ncbi:hypothetical protein Q9189_002813 [Teloschistes chrysophthalmus]